MVTTTSTTGTSARTQRAALRKRTRAFAKEARSFVRKTPRDLASLSDARNLIRSSGFVGASYIDADEAADGREFLRRIGDCRRQSKLSVHWLELLEGNLEERSEESRASLAKEAAELERIFGAIIGSVLKKKREEA
ncbi:MAG: hypothetical protein WCX61_01610 [Candidatus Peribacteraceae bacterium]|jgi:hypothetical protein